jgi:hypothetical protein
MYDPMTVAHEIKSPFKKKTPYGIYRKSLITIWHNDPESDGTDDSCGWFIRSRHVDNEVLEKIKREFNFHLKHNYWWDKSGQMVFSPIATLLMMYKIAAYSHYKNWDRADRFVKKNLANIIIFAENETDCIFSFRKIVLKASVVEDFANVVYSDIVRKTRPWYKHPRWHIHHWKIQIHWPSWMKKKHNTPVCDGNLRDTV